MIDEKQALVLQRLASAIQRINLYPVNRAISFPSTYPLYGDLLTFWLNSAIQHLNNQGKDPILHLPN